LPAPLSPWIQAALMPVRSISVSLWDMKLLSFKRKGLMLLSYLYIEHLYR
jgi:hypothetical protein